MSDREEIQSMIDQYNAVELEQGARRGAIVEAIRTLPGYHRLVLNGRIPIDVSYTGHRSVLDQQIADTVQTVTSWC